MHVSMQRQSSIEEALDIVIWYNHVHGTLSRPLGSSRENICREDALLFIQSPAKEDPEVASRSSDVCAVVLQLVDRVKMAGRNSPHPIEPERHTASAISAVDVEICHEPHNKVMKDDKDVVDFVDTAAEETILLIQ